jgi:hypothetical protein
VLKKKGEKGERSVLHIASLVGTSPSCVQLYDATQSLSEGQVKADEAKMELLGNIEFLGELYKSQLLSDNLIHLCLSQFLNPPGGRQCSEVDVEAVCRLLECAGAELDASSPSSHLYVSDYMECLQELRQAMKGGSFVLPFRLRCLVADVHLLRERKWQRAATSSGPVSLLEFWQDKGVAREDVGKGGSRRSRRSKGSPRRGKSQHRGEGDK